MHTITQTNTYTQIYGFTQIYGLVDNDNDHVKNKSGLEEAKVFRTWYPRKAGSISVKT